MSEKMKKSENEKQPAPQNSIAKSRELAARLYDLDSRVYYSLGTLISRSYTGDRDRTIENLAEMMVHESNTYKLRNELAMVANMARTIPDKKVRADIMREYNSILQEVLQLPHTIGTYDIKDDNMARMNESLLGQRFSENDHLIICISRSMGCAGTDIGFALADALKISFYDSEIFEMVLDRVDADKEVLHDPHSDIPSEKIEERRTLKQRLEDLKRYHGLPRQDALFFNQSDLLCELAKKEDFVVMGRCADHVLTQNHIPHISIFIDAPFDLRVRYTMEKHNVDRLKAIRMLIEHDRRRRKYYEFFTGCKWGVAANYDLCINSSCYGINGSVELISRLVNRTLGGNPKAVKIKAAAETAAPAVPAVDPA